MVTFKIEPGNNQQYNLRYGKCFLYAALRLKLMSVVKEVMLRGIPVEFLLLFLFPSF